MKPIETAQITLAQADPMGFFDPSILLLLGFLALMYFFIIRPQNKRNRELREMIAALQKDDEVITNGGLVGVIRELNDQFAMIEVGDKIQVRVQRSAIATQLPKNTIGSS
ncbi:MAG: preprotein translocase subunit YajC [Gammaproteobacteria bacterium]